MKRAALVACLVLLGGCDADGNCHVGPATWICSGNHTQVDAGTDAEADAAPPSPNVSPDAPADSAPDARSDAAVDARLPGSSMRVGTQLWQLGWMDPSLSFKPGYNFAAAVGSPWQDALVSDLSQYTGPLRSMDAVATNNTKISAWSGRTKKTDPLMLQVSDNGVAWEHWIDLCNRTHRDCWLNVPYLAVAGRNPSEYATQLAVLVKDQLDPSLRAFVEYSNEAWNGAFPTLNYELTQGLALRLDVDRWTNAFKYHAVASVVVFRAFEGVFGADSQRVVRVLAGQRGNAWMTGVHLDQLAVEGARADAYAVAPYLDGTTIADMQAALDPMFHDEIKPVVDVAKSHGLPTVCYEGGQEIYSSAIAPNRDPAMYDVYVSYLDHAAALGITSCALYLHVAPCGQGGCWGARESLSQPLAQAHKFRAILDWMRAHP